MGRERTKKPERHQRSKLGQPGKPCREPPHRADLQGKRKLRRNSTVSTQAKKAEPCQEELRDAELVNLGRQPGNSACRSARKKKERQKKKPFLEGNDESLLPCMSA